MFECFGTPARPHSHGRYSYGLHCAQPPWQAQLCWPVTLLPSYGLYGYGLYGYGLYGYGRYGYGLHGYGLYSYGLYGYGLYRYGLYGYGPCSYGLYNDCLYGCGLYSHGPLPFHPTVLARLETDDVVVILGIGAVARRYLYSYGL